MNIKNISFSILLALTFTACDLVGDIDSINPEYQLEEKEVMTDAQSAELLMRGLYQTWRGWNLGSSRAHGAALIGSIDITGFLNGQQGFNDNTVQPDNILVTNLYSDLYKVVNTANIFLAQLEAGKAPDLNDGRRTEMMAEAKLHRAMAWFYLLRDFGQFYDLNSDLGIVVTEIPYRDEPLQYARATVQASYDKIMADVDFTVGKLPTNTESYYLSNATALAFKAKVLLFTKNYPQAETAAKEAIDAALAANYMLEAAYADVFENGYNSPEVLFAPYTMGFEEAVSLDFNRIGYSNHTKVVSDLLPDGLEDGDPGTGENMDLRFFITFPGNRSPVGKYPHPDRVANTRGNTHFFLRLAEIYLIHAEAAARNTRYDLARASLLAVSSRVGYNEEAIDAIVDNELLEAIRKHKWMELIGENYELWFDVVRFHSEGNLTMNEVTAIKATLQKEFQFILPIPENALAGNNLLVQNPQ